MILYSIIVFIVTQGVPTVKNVILRGLVLFWAAEAPCGIGNTTCRKVLSVGLPTTRRRARPAESSDCFEVWDTLKYYL